MAVLLVAWPRASQNTNRPRSEQGPGGKETVTGEVLVKFRPGHNAQNVEDAELEVDAEPSESIGHGEVRLLRSRSRNVIDMVNALSRRGDVEYAEPNYIVHATVTPNDPQFGQLWGLLNTGQKIGGVTGTAGADIHATSAWNVTTGSRANVVAVIDTGIDYTHPDLMANVWTAPAAFSVTIAGRTIACPAGTTHGFNAILNTCDPADDNNHGTHVSGTIGAVGNNGTGVVGVNWTASIMASKFLDATGSGSLSDAINAIEFAIQTKAIFGAQANVRVLSNSWGGGGFSQALMDEIAKANASDMLFVAAAGNNGTNNDATPAFPSNYNVPNVVAVAATDNRDRIASFSNFGPTTVHLGAPGVNILSTIRGGGFAAFNGTSMATPHVSGAAALVLSACALSTANLKTTLLTTVDHVASLATRTITGGRLNVSNAINTCAAPPVPDFTVSATPASRTVTQGGGTSYTVTVTPTGGFTGSVALSVSGLPAGATGSFSPPSVTSGASTLTVTTAAATPTGSSTLTITGTSGSARTAQVALVVNTAPLPDFTVTATPASRTVTAGIGTTYTVTVTPTGGFAASVALSASGFPAGASGTFSPAAISSGSSTLTVTTTAATTVGSFPLTLTATSGTITHTAPVTLVVNPPSLADTVRGTRAEYTAGNGQLRLEATSTSSSATLQAFVTSTNQLIGTMTNQGGGNFRAQLTWPVNPENVKFVSSAGGTSTMAVTLK